jgi:hypothetical protein
VPSVRGDLGLLGELEANLRRLSSVPSRASKQAAENISSVIQEQFDAGVDAYGEPWAPLAPSTLAKKTGPGILDETSAMRDSIEVSPMAGAGIKIVIDDEKAIFHQTGTTRMPARPILPTGEMPDTWERAIADAVEESIERTMKSEE